VRLDVLLSDLKRDEGLRLKPYLCTAGRTTIGVGRNLDDVGITEAEALYLLENDIGAAIRVCRRLFPTWDSMTDARQEALANMAFNLGEAGLSKFKQMRAAIEAGDWNTAAQAVLASKYAYQVGDRAKRIAAALLNG
jgi:lysozyme